MEMLFLTDVSTNFDYLDGYDIRDSGLYPDD